MRIVEEKMDGVPPSRSSRRKISSLCVGELQNACANYMVWCRVECCHECKYKKGLFIEMSKLASKMFFSSEIPFFVYKDSQ